MKESVSGILICKDEFFVIQRQNYLRAFPGYYSFPGGKVDETDKGFALDIELDDVPSYQLVALRRELEEELGIDIVKLMEQGIIKSISKFGVAITPDFNPYRFKNHYFKIFLKEKVDLIVDKGESQFSGWMKSVEGFDQYERGEMLVVPPMISIFLDLKRDINNTGTIDPNLKYDNSLEVPLIKPLGGLLQFLPLSNTFPPANRTNCFLIGDKLRVLIDPSPKCLEEYKKLLHSISKFGVDRIFLTHHHPDHHQFSPKLALELQVPIMLSEDSHRRIIKKYGDDYFKDIEILKACDGDVLTISRGHEVDVVATPGHDEGQLSLIRRDKQWAIVSDLIQTVGTVLVGSDEGDMNKYFRSLEKIIEIAPKHVFPSHGIGIGGINKLQFTLKHRLLREQQVKKLLDLGVDSQGMLALIYPDLPERLHQYALLTLVAHISKIELIGQG